MKISYNWLKEYINIDLAPEKVAELLVNSGLEVEGIESFETVKGGLEGLVIGEVLTCEKHPNADKLSKTTVNIGGEILPIVCGASNVAAGQKVVVATIGTTLYDGDESFKIKKGKIRGEDSYGMLCGEDEVGLGKNHDGIMVLPAEVKAGTLAKDFFKVETDTIFEIGITPNRIDGASHLGVARDLVAAVNHLKLQEKIAVSLPSVDAFKVENNDYQIDIKIENTEGCKRYAGVTISGVEIKDSPDWLKNRLKAIGLNPINNVVDVTNFILHELGQPLHGFDADMISGKQVIVKTLPQDTKFVTLDGVERNLSSNDLMICNAEEGMVIAGVFGGLKSGVSETTKNIFIESAYFNPVFVRRSSKRHGLNTDSSFRFERGANPNIAIYALKRAALLIQELAGGVISSDIKDVYPEPIQDFAVEILYANFDRLIGKHIDSETIKSILTSLEIRIENETSEGLSLKVPPYRVDVQREADVIEEVLRIYGYNNIEISTNVKSTISYSPKPDTTQLRNAISDLLSSNGFNEIMSNSLTKSSYFENLSTFSADNTVKIVNPLSSDLNAMRQSLLFGGMEAVQRNTNYKNSDLKLYEFGYCYFFKKENTTNVAKELIKNYLEEHHLGLFLTGNKTTLSWNAPLSKTNFFELKAYTELILKRLGYVIDSLEVSEIDSQKDIFAYGLSYFINKKTLVDFGAVSKKVAKPFDTEDEVFYADFAWDNVIAFMPEKSKYKEMAKYPEVKRDLALLIDKSVTFAQLKTIANKTERKLLKSVSIFDVYEGEKLGEGKKSYALNFVLQDEEKTLNEVQITTIMDKLSKAFEKEVDAKVRQS